MPRDAQRFSEILFEASEIGGVGGSGGGREGERKEGFKPPADIDAIASGNMTQPLHQPSSHQFNANLNQIKHVTAECSDASDASDASDVRDA